VDLSKTRDIESVTGYVCAQIGIPQIDQIELADDQDQIIETFAMLMNASFVVLRVNENIIPWQWRPKTNYINNHPNKLHIDKPDGMHEPFNHLHSLREKQRIYKPNPVGRPRRPYQYRKYKHMQQP
jgi:hypothetical protein